MQDLLFGRFHHRRQLITWLAVTYGVSLVLALIAVARYPDHNVLEITRTCVSKLGSPEKKYNATGYMWFCASLVLSGVVFIGLVRCHFNGLRSALGRSFKIRFLNCLQVIGVLGWIGCGMFPMSSHAMVGSITWNDIHHVVAKSGFISFGTAFVLEAYLIYREGAKSRHPDAPALNRWHAAGPCLLVTVVGTAAVFFMLSWDYQRMNDPSLRWTGTGLYAFPLWEWMLTFTLPIAVAWAALFWQPWTTLKDRTAQVGVVSRS